MSLSWRRSLHHAAIAYVVSRMLVVVGVGIVAAAEASAIAQRRQPKPKSAARIMLDALGSWDGVWYLRVVRLGYPDRVPPSITYGQIEARAAFFPGYPWLVKGLNPVVPGDVLVAGLIVNVVLGAALVYLVGRITREVFDVVVARRAMVLTALFPGSYVLSFAYAEALLLVLAAACLWCLLRERWWWAGIAGALATFTRPNGLAVVVACLAAAIVSWRSTRSWKPFVAPLLAPLGFVAFQLYVGWRTGEQGVWFRVQREAWKEGTSFGLTAVRDLGEFLVRPFSSPTNAVTGATVVVLALLLWCLWKARLPLPLVAYAIAVVVLMLLPETVTARPRFVFTAFPLLIAAAKVWPERRSEAWSYVTAVCGAGLVTLSALYGLDQVVIP